MELRLMLIKLIIFKKNVNRYIQKRAYIQNKP